jgi:O-antigen/teichoic acid export membrane protein
MGIIQKQSIRSSIIIMLGFCVGAFNLLFLAPKVLTATEFGLTRIITDAAITLATLCTFGSLPVVYKFFPFYKSYLPAKKNDLPFVTLFICLAGFIVMCIIGFSSKDIIIRKFSSRSPLFVEYYYLVYPFALFFLLFIWAESFAWSFKKGVISNTLRELLPRILFFALLVFMGASLIDEESLYILFSLSYLLPFIILFALLRKEKDFVFNPSFSSVTLRLGPKMLNFGLFLFGAQFLNLLSKTADTFILTAKASRGLTDTAVFTYATYIVTLMEIPQRSITSISTPVLAESWKNKDVKRIGNIYTKSVTNLLIIGLVMFGLIIVNIDQLYLFLGKDYAGIKEVVLVMGIGKLIDLGTGVNSQIIGTSSYWKVDFTTNVIYTVIALPLNYVLISQYGLMGAAYSYIISLSFYNLIRFGFLWYQFKLQPYTLKDLLAIAIAIPCTVITYFLPSVDNLLIDTMLKSLAFCILFGPAIYYAKISAEVNELIRRYLKTGLNFFSGS